MTKVKKISILLLFLTIHLFSFSQPQYGLPFIINYFDEKEPNKSEQVWDIKQTECGLLYFASNYHFVEFDGSKWTDFVRDIGSQFLSFDFDSVSKTFFIGGKNSLLVSKLIKGQYHTENISVSLPINSTWKTFFSNGIAYYFINKKDVIIYEKNSIELVHRPSNFEITRGFKVNDIIYAVSNKGIGILNGSNIKLISLKKENIYRQDIRTILYFNDSTLLIGTKTGNLYLFYPESDSFTKFSTEVDDYLYNNQIYNGAIIDSSSIALATLQGGLVIINNKGELKNIINKETGLLSDAIYSVFVDDNKNLWLGTGMGVSFVNWGSSIRYFDKRNMINDLVNAVTIFNDKLVVSSADGFFVGNLKEKPVIVKPNKYQFLYGGNFISLFVDNKKYIAVSEYDGISFFGENLDFINNIQIYRSKKIIQSPVVENRYYVANFNELVTIDVSKITKNKTITLEHHFFDLPTNIQNIKFDSDNDLWLCRDKDLLLIDFDENESLNDYSHYLFNDISGLPDSVIFNILEYQYEIIVSTKAGLYVLENRDAPKSEYRFVKYKDGVFSQIKNSIITSYISVDSFLFIQTQNTIFRFNKTTNDVKELFFGNIFDLQFTSIYLYENLIWTNSRNKVLCIDPLSFNEHIYPKEKFILRSVKIGNNKNHIIYTTDSIVEKNDSSYNILQKISQENNSISLTFAFPLNNNQDRINYYYFIEKKDEEWQKIESGNILTLRQLSAGKYSISIKAVNFYGVESNIISINFIVKTKFYLSKVAIALYIIFFGLFLFLFSYLRGKKITREKIKLENVIRQRTEELTQQNDELEQQSNLLIEQKKLLVNETEQLKLASIELKQLSLVARRTNNSVLILEKNGKVEWWNRGYTDLFSYKINQYKDLPLRLSFKKIRNDVLKEVRVYSEDKGIISFTNHEIFDDGEEIWYQTTISPVYDEKGNLFKFVVIDINISDIKIAEKEILNQKQQLKNSKENFTELYANQISTKEQHNIAVKTNNENLFYVDFLYNIFTINSLNFDNKLKYIVLNKPLEKLSGDFIWNLDYNNKLYIVLGDATGHKIRGTIVSVLAINILEKIILSNGNKTPALILNQFNKEFNLIINSAEKFKDSIDIALVSIDKKNHKLEFSGARIPLFLIKNSSFRSIDTFEADRISIGANGTKKFLNQFVTLKNKDRIYLITDGWINQFGKLGQKKYTTKKLKDFLLDIQKHTIKEQQKLFEEEITNWKGNFEQVDDIFVFGAEIIIE